MKRVRVGLVLAFMMGASLLFGIAVELPEDTLSPRGAGANKNIFVKNPSEIIKAVEISITKRSHDLQGKETRSELADDLFLVTPTQLLLYPGEEKVITVRWMGPVDLTKEEAYRVIVEEVSLKNDLNNQEGAAQIKLLLKFVRAFYVNPGNTRAKFAIENISPTNSVTEGIAVPKPMLQFDLVNIGTAHSVLESIKVTLTDSKRKSKSLRIESSSIPMPNLLSDDRRRVIIPWPEELAPGPIKAQIEEIKSI